MTHNAAIASASSDFWDRIAPRYAKQPIKDIDAYEAMLNSLYAELSPTDHVLEIGCGTGSTAILLAEKVQHITATDISEGMISIARSKLKPPAPTNIVFQRADAAALIGKEAFDVVFATSLLHLIDDIDLVLRRAYKQLKPGGRLITKTVCIKNLNPLIRLMVRALTMFGLAPKVTALTVSDLEEAIQGAGFRIQRVEYFGKNKRNPFIVAQR